MSLRNFYQDGKFGLSFELYPPKTDAGLASLMKHVEQLTSYDPDYFTCTYGAGGSTRDKTLEIIEQVKSGFQIPVASHLTVVGSSVEQLRSYLSEASARGVDYIVALRGDPPKGESTFVPNADGLRYANELVELIRREFKDFGIAVAGYPEKHIEAASFAIDLQNLKRKVDTGADIVVTQLFYQNDDFYRFRDECESLGISCPIIPGILPVTNWGQVQRITSLCGAKLPPALLARFDQVEGEEAQFDVGVQIAIEQVQDLIDQGVAGMHFYVLNHSRATSQVLDAVNIPQRVFRKA
jgi:methylenetetrahydrofolate reductase (NADPH)